jgi:hypothetical protein
MNVKERQQFEQSLAALSEINPSVWWGLYTGNLRMGFTESQALLLVQTYIMANHGSPVYINGQSIVAEKREEDE